MTPFFIVGCVRSGTTLLRNILRQHPNLCCPEETQIFRWGHPFGTKGFMNIYQANAVFRKHRQIDGIAEEEYLAILESSTSRSDFMDRYLAVFRKVNGFEQRRVFDKSPQNVYGIALIKSSYPEAKFVSIVRNPLNVVASLREGRVMHVPELYGACSYWNEAVAISQFFRTAMPSEIYEFRYENFLERPHEFMREILRFIGEGDVDYAFDLADLRPERDNYKQTLSEEEIGYVLSTCGSLMDRYGYAANPSNDSATLAS